MGYVQLLIPRIAFTRLGLSIDRDWSTVTGVRLTYKSVAGSTGVVKMDELVVKAGADGRLLAGIYKLRARYLFSDGLFEDQSHAGPATGDIFVNGQAIKATLTPNCVAEMDEQVTSVWFYLFSDQLGSYFKVRDELDLTMSKFCLNEFDVIMHSGVNSDDMMRHCTVGMVPGPRFTADAISQSSSDASSTTEVPYTATPSGSVYSSVDWLYFGGRYEIQVFSGPAHIYVSKPALGLGASSITDVTFAFTGNNNGFPDTNAAAITPFIEIGGVKYFGSTTQVYNAVANATHTWTVSPATGLPFTEAELDGAYFGCTGTCDPAYRLFVDMPGTITINYLKTETVVTSVDDSYNPYQLTISSSDTDMLLDNIVLDTAETEPPSNVIQIIGPHYGRLLCITPTYIYPSQPGRPSIYKYVQAFRISDGVTERTLWATIIGGSVFVGTTADIYRIDGDFQELPNGTLNINVNRLGVGDPPVSKAFAVSDDMLVYNAANGWRVLVGNSSTSIKSNAALLYEGYTRHGITPTDPTIGVQSAAFGRRGLHVLYPDTQHNGIRLNEFIETGVFEFNPATGFISATAVFSVPVGSARRVMEFDVVSKEWMPRTYPTNISVLARTTSGRLIGGTLDGKVIEFEKGNTDLDAAIEVVARTPYVDNGLPLTHKELFELALTADAGGSALTYEVWDDINTTAILSDSASPSGRTVVRRNMNGLKARRFQLRASGNFSTLRLYDFNMSMRPVPQHRTYLDTGNIRVGAEEFHWFRQIRLMAVLNSDITIDIYFDETLLYSEPLTAVVGSAKIYTVDLERDASGKQPRLVIRTGTAAAEATSEVGFEIYWIEWVTRTSGRKNKQPRIRWDSSTNDNVPPE